VERLLDFNVSLEGDEGKLILNKVMGFENKSSPEMIKILIDGGAPTISDEKKSLQKAV